MSTLSLNQENLVLTNLRTIQELSVIQRIYRLSQQYAGMNNLFMSQMMVWYIFGKLCKNTRIVKKTCLNDLMRPTGGSVGLPPSAHDSCEGHLISRCHYHCIHYHSITVQIGSHSEQRAAQDFGNLFTGTGLRPHQHPANLVVFKVKE